ncbi:MAG: hypothetical protein Q7R35_19160 [Elusimicrobiota bacterium]|nr:hypothetical protein [Elusimicrobiota bacterium]
MEKERAIQCVPVELLEKLKTLAARLWEDRNPASVHLNAILDEFEPDVRTLGNVITEYEADHSGRLAFAQSEYAQKESLLKKVIEDLKGRMAGIEASRAEAVKKNVELRSEFNAREELLAELKSKNAEHESVVNARFSTRMEELYIKVNNKEMEILAQWEEKNKALETKAQELNGKVDKKEREILARWEEKNKVFSARAQELESNYAATGRQLKLRERALEEDYNARKAELIRTFDRIRAGLEAKEKELSAREAGQAGGAL